MSLLLSEFNSISKFLLVLKLRKNELFEVEERVFQLNMLLVV